MTVPAPQSPKAASERVHDLAWLFVLAACFGAYQLQSALGGEFTDLRNVHDAARAAMDGLPIYGLETRGGDYVHTPGSTLLLFPLGLLPFSVAGGLVVVCSVASMAGAAYVASKSLRDRSQATAALGAVLLVFSLSEPFGSILGLANLDALLAAPLATALYFLGRGDRQVAAAVLLGVTLTIKPTLGLVVLVPLILGFKQTAAFGGLLCLSLNGLGYLLLPGAERFFTTVLPFLLEPETTGYNVSLAEALKRLGSPEAAVLGARLLAGFALVAVWAHFRRELHEDAWLAMLLVLVATPLVGGYFFGVYSVYLVIVAPILLVAAATACQRVLLAATAYVLLSDDTFRSGTRALDEVLGLRVAVSYMALATLLVLILRERRRSAALVGYSNAFCPKTSRTPTPPASDHPDSFR